MGLRREARRAGSKLARTPAAVKTKPLALAELLERTRELPGVESAAYASIGVLEGNMMMTEFEVSRPDGETVTVNNVYALNVGSEYFETGQTPLLRGREVSGSDRKDGPAVVIVNASLAKKAWPGQNPLGRQLSSRWAADAQVVGLVGDSKYANVREDALPIVYRAFEKFAWSHDAGAISRFGYGSGERGPGLGCFGGAGLSGFQLRDDRGAAR